MRYRLATLKDSRELAKLHLICLEGLAYNMEILLGKSYIEEYYRILLTENGSVVLCAEDDRGHLVGMVSGVLDYQLHRLNLQRKRLRLLVFALGGLLRRPGLIGRIIARNQAGSSDENERTFTGAVATSWFWLPDVRSGGESIILFQKWLALLRLLGVKKVSACQDKDNQRVAMIHRFLGGRFVREYRSPDGIQRLEVHYVLDRNER